MPGMGADLLCIGNAMADFFVPAAAEQLDALGITEAVQHVPPDKAAELLRSFPGAVSFAGGGAGNAARAAASLGVATVFAGSVGDDELGRFYEAALKNAGIGVRLFKAGGPTGICLVFRLPKAEIRIAASPGAALELPASFIDDELIQTAKVLALDGFMLRRGDLIRHILEKANRYGTVAALDLGSAEIAGEQAPNILRYSREYPLILLMNENETRSFYAGAGSSAAAEDAPGKRKTKGEIHRIFRFLRDLTSQDIFPIVVVKQGARGSTVFAGGAVHRKTTLAMAPRDSVGAGDSFCAGFLAAWLQGKSLGDCADLGNRAARETLYNKEQVRGSKEQVVRGEGWR
jgi:sugar/nucleoside kinase (ribokinase family)